MEEMINVNGVMWSEEEFCYMLREIDRVKEKFPLGDKRRKRWSDVWKIYCKIWFNWKYPDCPFEIIND